VRGRGGGGKRGGGSWQPEEHRGNPGRYPASDRQEGRHRAGTSGPPWETGSWEIDTGEWPAGQGAGATGPAAPAWQGHPSGPLPTGRPAEPHPSGPLPPPTGRGWQPGDSGGWGPDTGGGGPYLPGKRQPGGQHPGDSRYPLGSGGSAFPPPEYGSGRQQGGYDTGGLPPAGDYPSGSFAHGGYGGDYQSGGYPASYDTGGYPASADYTGAGFGEPPSAPGRRGRRGRSAWPDEPGDPGEDESGGRYPGSPGDAGYYSPGTEGHAAYEDHGDWYGDVAERRSWASPGGDDSGFLPGPHDSGFQPGIDDSGLMPGYRRFQPGADDSGLMPAADDSGFLPGPADSGLQPGLADDSGLLPALGDPTGYRSGPRGSHPAWARSAQPAGRGAPGRRGGARRIMPRVFLGLLALAVLAAGGGFYYVYRTYLHPADYSGAGTGSVIVQIKQGDTATVVGERLQQLGVVASARAFANAAKASPQGNSLEPGYYRLHKHMSAVLAFRMLLEPSSRFQYRVTIPEGWRLSQIIATLGRVTHNLAGYQKAIKDTAALGLPSYARGNPEGFLFPATYTIEPGTPPAEVLRAMVQRFGQEAAHADLPVMARRGQISEHDVIVVASLIQAEGGRVQDYPKIAEVIYNRLNSGMPLQLDSTIMYALHTSGIMATDQQLKVNSPYNTYAHTGLPPGPIDSPGDAAIQAALHPDHGSYLYFVTVDPRTRVTRFTSDPAVFAQLRAELQHNLAHGQ
jgi:UPF0755 protein